MFIDILLLLYEQGEQCFIQIKRKCAGNFKTREQEMFQSQYGTSSKPSG